MIVSEFEPKLRGTLVDVAMLFLPALVVVAQAHARDAVPPLSSMPAPAALAIVIPTHPYTDLANVDLTGIGGAGSHVAKATETIRNGVPVCSVEGTLAPAIGFRLDLPVKSWT